MNRKIIGTPIWRNDVTSRKNREKGKNEHIFYNPTEEREKRRHSLYIHLDRVLRKSNFISGLKVETDKTEIKNKYMNGYQKKSEKGSR